MPSYVGYTKEIEYPTTIWEGGELRTISSQWLTLEFELGFDVSPGEKRVDYYPDGSGYPGSPPSAELVDVRLQSISGEAWELKRPEAPELFLFFQQWLPDTQTPSYWEELFFDHADSSDMGGREDD